jgi:tRNA (adenine-N(1)-)-methyltransferase non-catalytic subunit
MCPGVALVLRVPTFCIICSGLRSDSLAQLLTAANIHVGGRVLVVDGVGGVLVGAVAERMGSCGTIIVATEAHHVMSPAWAHLQKYNLGKNFGGLDEDKLKIFTVGMQSLVDWSSPEGRRIELEIKDAAGTKRRRVPESSIDAAPEPKRMATEDESADPTKSTELQDAEKSETTPLEPAMPLRQPFHKHARAEGSLHVIKPLRLSDAQKQEQLLSGVDSVIIACPYKPTLLLLAALRYARPSAAYAVFCAEEHSLAETYRQVKSLGVAINNDLHETWYRPYQVLPGRTHPMMSMHGASGYLLNGIAIENEYTIPGKIYSPSAAPEAT